MVRGIEGEEAAGAVEGAGEAALAPELGGFFRGGGRILGGAQDEIGSRVSGFGPHVEAGAGGEGEEVVGELRLGRSREEEGINDVLAQGELETGGEIGAEAGGVDDDLAAEPDGLEQV